MTDKLSLTTNLQHCGSFMPVSLHAAFHLTWWNNLKSIYHADLFI